MIEEMPKDGRSPDVVTYNLLMEYLCKNKRCIEARKIFDFMVQRVPTQMSLYMAFCLMHMLLKVLSMQGLKLDVANYQTVIDALCKVGRMDDAMSQFNQMINEGLTPDRIIFTTLIHGLCTIGKWKKAEASIPTLCSSTQ
uniref:Pentacotripeptide-repeat region of PRORP domain-containing protein n=1 Tax=Arundo donax TaxID=35708 RepID=A0A0A9GXW6_ARUDO